MRNKEDKATFTEFFEELIERVDGMLDTKRKRHICGGIFISASLLFGGLAITALTIKEDDSYE